ncbi:MAG TPA: MaoC family dehydratase N-terminal domain-containing protein [Deltaproteobacteria bacterium]|nr:MaoC family dehydratase N-terminal domain-containing protein [Bacillota bacterium]HOM28696.1 MaoC family dehydratase N-terminal domain-containing protein [Deltaproteobacteria bacterium]HPP79638.1 MaoC family dehydratase N-terminal domain-containing protein [Deltaproteobacteria bacterium]
MADHSKVGREYAPVTWEVERGKIRELAKAIGDMNPIYHDRDAAVREGYKETPVPPTFLTVPMMWSTSMPGVINDLGINFMMVLHGEEEYEYYGEIYPGDVITAVPRVASIEEKTSKSGRKMDMVTIELVYTNQRGEKVARARTLLVERK